MEVERKRTVTGAATGLYGVYAGYIRAAAGKRHAAADACSAGTVRRRTAGRLMRYRNTLESRKGENA